MSETNALDEKKLSASIRFNSVLLGLFAVVTTAVLAFTYSETKERIAEQRTKAQLAALTEILPTRYYDNDLIHDGVVDIPQSQWPLLNLTEPSKAYIARKDNRDVAILFPTNGTGYSGNISLLVGIKVDGSLAGVRVTQHAETPGLGDFIDSRKSDWILMFDGKSLTNPQPQGWETKNHGGEFDGLTSATISSRGVIHQVKAALEYFNTQHPLQTLPAGKGENKP